MLSRKEMLLFVKCHSNFTSQAKKCHIKHYKYLKSKKPHITNFFPSVTVSTYIYTIIRIKKEMDLDLKK